MDTPGQRIKLLRGRKTQKEVQVDTGIEYYTQSNDETGVNKNIPKERLLIYSKYYGKSIDWILYGDETNANKSITLKDLLLDNAISFNGQLLTNKEKEIILKMAETIDIIREK